MQPSIPRSARFRHSAIAITALLLFVLALAAAGCGAGSASGPLFGNVGDDLQGEHPAGGAPDEEAPAASGAGQAFDATGSSPPIPFAALADRQIIKTGEVMVEVDNVAAALGRVRAMTVQVGGYVGGSQAGTLEDSATLTLRIPADRFEDALAQLHELEGKILSEATREEDVTSAIVDLEARIANLEASELQYRALVERAQAIEDILAVQTRLDGVRGEIEQLSAQLEQLSGLAGMSTLTVTLTPSPTPVVEQATGDWDPGATFENAMAALVGFGQGATDVLIWLGIVGLPLLAGVGIVALVLGRVLPLARRRLPAPPVE
jgi:hypothetical protein